MRWEALVLFMVVFVGAGYAFPASMAVEDRFASPDDPAKFTVEVKNDFTEMKIFQLSVSPYSPWFYLENPKSVEPGENATFEVVVSPPADTVQQNYLFELSVRTGSHSEKFSSYFSFNRENALAFRSISTDRNSYRPGETIGFSVDVLNTAPRIIENYSVKARFRNDTFSEKGLTISPHTFRRVELKVDTPENIPPGEKQVRLSINRNGETGETAVRTFHVEKVASVERSRTGENRVLTRTRTLSVRNTGNTGTVANLTASLKAYLGPISSFSREPTSTRQSGGTNYYTWSFELKPGEQEKVKYRVNYWIPVVVLVALMALILSVKRLWTPVSFRKTAVAVEDGVKIRLELENQSGQLLKDVAVKDFIPDVATVSEDFPMARPIIRKTSNGTRLQWEIEELEPGDQRVLEYVIKPLIEVEGGITLPEAGLESEGEKITETGKAEAEFRPGEST